MDHMNQNGQSGGEQPRWTVKRIAALSAIILLVLMYLLTLVFAICKFPGSDVIFRCCIAATIIIPVISWFIIWMYGKFARKKTIATLFPNGPTEEEILEARIYEEEVKAHMEEKEKAEAAKSEAAKSEADKSELDQAE